MPSAHCLLPPLQRRRWNNHLILSWSYTCARYWMGIQHFGWETRTVEKHVAPSLHKSHQPTSSLLLERESMKMPAVDGKRCKYTWVNVRIATNKSIRLRPYAQHIVSTLTLPTRCFHADSSDYPCLKKLFGSPSCLPRNVRNRWQFHQEMVEWNKTATIAKWWIVGDRRLARTNMQTTVCSQPSIRKRLRSNVAAVAETLSIFSFEIDCSSVVSCKEMQCSDLLHFVAIQGIVEQRCQFYANAFATDVFIKWKSNVPTRRIRPRKSPYLFHGCHDQTYKTRCL